MAIAAIFKKDRGEAQVSRRFTGAQLKKLIVPLIIEQFLAVSIGMIDTIMLSSVSEAAVSGVSSVDMVNALLINIFASLATGGAVVASQFIGSRDKKRANESAVQLVIVSLVVSLLIMGVVLIFNQALLNLLFRDVDAEVMDSARIYFVISALSYPALALYNCFAALFRSMGNSRIAMFASLCVNVVNIIGNAILIYGMQMGVTGAALATLFSRAAAMVFLGIMIGQKKNDIRIDYRKIPTVNFSIIKKILYIGIPSSLENSMFQFGKVIVTAIIAAYGTVHMAANAVAGNLASLGCIPGFATGLAMITVVGQCIGAGDHEEATYYTKKLMKITYFVMGIINLVVIFTLPLSLKLYTDVSDEAKHIAIILTMIHAGSGIFIWPAAFTLPNALRAAGDVKFTMLVSITTMWTFRVLLSYILGAYCGWGVIGVWISMIVDWIFRMAFFVWRFFTGKWLKKSLV